MYFRAVILVNKNFMSKETTSPQGDWPAFPMHYNGEHKCHTGISARDHACIELRVPCSSHDWLNKLIRASREADLVERFYLSDGNERGTGSA